MWKKYRCRYSAHFHGAENLTITCGSTKNLPPRVLLSLALNVFLQIERIVSARGVTTDLDCEEVSCGKVSSFQRENHFDLRGITTNRGRSLPYIHPHINNNHVGHRRLINGQCARHDFMRIGLRNTKFVVIF